MAVPEVPFYILHSRVYSDSLCACAGKMEISTHQKGSSPLAECLNEDRE